MKPKRNKKKFLNIVLWLVAIFTLLLLIIFIVIRIKFPPKKIKTIATSQLSQALNNRRVEIDNVTINPVKGFKIYNVSIFEPDSVAKDTIKFVTIKDVYLKYKLSSLLKKTLRIKEIVINDPFIKITYNKQQKTNIDDLILPAVIDTTKILPAPDTTQLSLPFSFKLDKFNFKNFSAFISAESEDTKIIANINDLSVFIENLFIPRGSVDEIKKRIKAKFKIISPNSPWNIVIKSLQLKNPQELDVRFDLNVDFNVQSIYDMQLKGNAGFGEIVSRELGEITRIYKIPVNKLVNLIMDLQIDGEKGNINVQQLTAQLINENALSIHGVVSDLFTEPNIDLLADDSEIQLSKIINALKAIVPSDYQDQLRDLTLKGILSLKNTILHGNLMGDKPDDGLEFKTNIYLDECNISYPAPITNIDDLWFYLNINGLYNKNGIQHSTVKLGLKISALNSDVNDTIKITMKNFSTDLSAEISNDYFPRNMNLKTSMEEFLGAAVNFDLSFDSKEKLENYAAKAVLALNNLNLANLPQAPGSGLINSNILLNSSSLNEIDVNLNLSTDSLHFPVDSEQINISPFTLQGLVNIAADTSLEHIHIKQINLIGNNFLFIKGKADIQKMAEKGFYVTLDTVLLKHKELFDFLPKYFKEGLENLTITGTTLISSEITGKVPTVADTEILVNANADMNASIEYLDIPVTIGALLGTIKLNSNGTSTNAVGHFKIDDLIFSRLRDQPLNNSSLDLICHLPHFDLLQIDSSFLRIPDLNSKVSLVGRIDSLSTNPIVTLDLLYDFFALDSVLLINDAYLVGKWDSKINIHLQQPLVTVTGIINVNKLNALYSDQIMVQDISARIPFIQRYNIDDSILVNDSKSKLLLANVEGLNYDLLYPYYLNVPDEPSYLKIKNIKFQDYEISNFMMDINLGNGVIGIPLFSLNLYEGNVKGKIFANLHEGKLDKANYYLKANISRLNSAKISSEGRGSAEASELNMNMEFQGIGLDTKKNIDFSGYLYITKIGSKFTDNVLNSLDPKRTDKSIQDTKKLLKWGYKPKLISFEIKHGYMYPSIHLVKGNLFTKLIPLNLSGGKIELARIPIKFFLETQMTPTQ